ncbi:MULTISPECIES: porin family protein [Flavobacterium]|uniref:Outer membrane protein beta-barrel domain-containing protein n=1 Tax=Flavobacterium hankyongi TaxID=1176532 RepID=A0ABP8ZPF4_9FLAO|nr:porin family protein [Flavobacterium sp. N1846]
MKKITYLLLLLTNVLFAQINFEKGYYIDNSGQKIEGLIKDEDWMNNPTKFLFKKNDNDVENTKSIRDIKEFVIDNFSKYERVEVMIDTSSVDWRRLSYNKNPEWSKKVIFLKLIVDGDAKLYEFTDGTNKKFFYSFKNSAIEQLVYKEYTQPNSTTVIENNTFRQQLWNNVKCSQTEYKTLSKMKYKTSELIKYFLMINNCDGNKSIVETSSQVQNSKGSFWLKVKAGANFSNLTLASNYNVLKNVEFGNKIGPKIGVEFEINLGFNKNKWSVFYEPTYQKYKSEMIKKLYGSDYRYNANITTIDHLLGVKYYMFLNKDSKLFVDAGLFFRQLSGDLQYGSVSGSYMNEYSLENYISFTGGLGFSYKKADFEVRYSKSSIIPTNLGGDSAKFGVISAVFGYKIFDFKKK